MRRKKTRTLSPTPQAGEFLVWQSELVFSLDHKDHSHRLRFSTSLFQNVLKQFTFSFCRGHSGRHSAKKCQPDAETVDKASKTDDLHTYCTAYGVVLQPAFTKLKIFY